MAKKKTQKSVAGSESAADRKLTIYMPTVADRDELQRVAGLMMPGMSVQMFLVVLAQRQIREFQKAEEAGRIREDEFGRANIIVDND